MSKHIEIVHNRRPTMPDPYIRVIKPSSIKFDYGYGMLRPAGARGGNAEVSMLGIVNMIINNTSNIQI